METKQRNASTASTSFHNHNVDEFVWKTLTESIDCGWLGDIEEEGFRKEIMDDNSSSSDDGDDDAAVVLRLPNISILNVTCTTDESFSEDEATPAEVAGKLNTDNQYPADEGEEVALSKAASAIIEEAIAKATAQQVSFPTVTTTTTTNTSVIKRQQRQSKVKDRDATNKQTKMVPTQPGSSSSCITHGKKSSQNNRQDPPPTMNPPENQILQANEKGKEDGSLAVTDSAIDTVLQESKYNPRVNSQPENDLHNRTLPSPTPTSSYNHLDYGDILVQQADKNCSNQVFCQNGLETKLSNHILNTNNRDVDVTVTMSDTKSENNNDKVPDGYPSDEEHGFKRAHHHCPSNEMVRQKGQKQSQQKYMILAALGLLLLLVGGCIVVTVLCVTGKCTSAKGDSSKSDSTSNTGKDDNKTVTIPTKFFAFQTTQELYDAVDQYSVVMASLDENVWAHHVSQTYGYPIGNWDVSKLTNFSRVFDPQRSVDVWNRNELGSSTMTVETLTEDLSKWDVSNAKTMYGMFAYSNWNVTGLSAWDISQVEELRYAFYHAQYFTDDLCIWGRSISQQTQVSNMFVHSACSNTSDPAYLIFGPMGLSGPWCENCRGQFGTST